MFNNQHNFLKGIIILYMILFLIIGGLLIQKYKITYRLSIGNIFNESNLVEYFINLIYLDDFHSKLILKKGLPLVRVKEDNLLAKSQEVDSVANFTFSFVTDLPLSFFEMKRPVMQRMKANENLKELKEAEGTHKNERVELDFWQTEPSTSQEKPRDNKLESIIANREGEFNKKDNNIFSNRSQISFQSPIVGIYHTHTAENYENRGYNAHASPGERGDIVLVGQELSNLLETKYGIPVVHSKKVHDKTYGKSYINSLQTGKNMVRDYSNLKMIFDIHRDAIEKGGRDLLTTTINGQRVSRIMIIVTNNNYGLPHPNWKQNVRFAKRLAEKMNDMYPGLLREVELINNRRYNQHVHPHALLLEIGGAKSTIPEAKRSAKLLADVLAELIDEGS